MTALPVGGPTDTTWGSPGPITGLRDLSPGLPPL